jgi:hypothetical protein
VLGRGGGSPPRLTLRTFMRTLRSTPMTCPYCRQEAPVIVRGVRAYCTACGAPRSIVTAPEAVNVVGQPARVGGTIAGTLGWAALLMGLALTLILGAIAGLLSGGAALWVGGFVLFCTLAVAVPLIAGGRKLKRSGEDRVRAAQEHAIFALASQRRGELTVRDVARALSVRESEADVLLTDLARRQDGSVTLEVDDNGGLSYLFHDLRASHGARVVAPPPRARVAAPPRVIDAELIDEDVYVTPEPRRASR